MSFSKDQLYSQEKIILNLRPHWWFFWRQVSSLLGSMVLGIIALSLFTDNPYLSLLTAALVLISLIWFGWRYWTWVTTNFVVTTDRLINRSGVLSRNGVEIPLERVNTVRFHQTFFERIIGSGDLEVESAGETGLQKFRDIRKPLKVQNEMYRQIEDNENRKFDRVGLNAATMGPDIPEQISKLDELRQRGVLSPAEFEQKKAELLSRM